MDAGGKEWDVFGQGVGRCMRHKKHDDVSGSDGIQDVKERSSEERSVTQSNSTLSDGTPSGRYQRRGRTGGYGGKEQR